MSKIVITGITSFIGVHLAKYFSSNKCNVIGTISRDISQYEGIKKVRIVEALNSKVKIEKLDITQSDELINIISKAKPDYWIHHAGWATDYSSFEYNFVTGFEVNVKPLSTLYPALKKCECKGIIITGSSAEYAAAAGGRCVPRGATARTATRHRPRRPAPKIRSPIRSIAHREQSL